MKTKLLHTQTGFTRVAGTLVESDGDDFCLVNRDRVSLAAQRERDCGVLKKESPHVVHETVVLQVPLESTQTGVRACAHQLVRVRREALAVMLALVSTLLPSASVIALSNWLAASEHKLMCKHRRRRNAHLLQDLHRDRRANHALGDLRRSVGVSRRRDEPAGTRAISSSASVSALPTVEPRYSCDAMPGAGLLHGRARLRHRAEGPQRAAPRRTQLSPNPRHKCTLTQPPPLLPPPFGKQGGGARREVVRARDVRVADVAAAVRRCTGEERALGCQRVGPCAGAAGAACTE